MRRVLRLRSRLLTSPARSMFSLAGAAGPNANAGQPVHINPTSDPTDDDLTNAIRSYLSTQDLMQVTKRTAREAIAKAFPKSVPSYSYCPLR